MLELLVLFGTLSGYSAIMLTISHYHARGEQ